MRPAWCSRWNGPGMEILDRVGGGDSFASGLIYGLMTDHDLAGAVEMGPLMAPSR